MVRTLLLSLALACIVCAPAAGGGYRFRRTPLRPFVGPVPIYAPHRFHHDQQFFFVPSSTIVAPQGFYGPTYQPGTQTIILVR